MFIVAETIFNRRENNAKRVPRIERDHFQLTIHFARLHQVDLHRRFKVLIGLQELQGMENEIIV